jgi:hypothetical protein
VKASLSNPSFFAGDVAQGMRREIRYNCISVNTKPSNAGQRSNTEDHSRRAARDGVDFDQINAELLAFFKPGKEAAA